jgi:hypothetical protein
MFAFDFDAFKKLPWEIVGYFVQFPQDVERKRNVVVGTFVVDYKYMYIPAFGDGVQYSDV